MKHCLICNGFFYDEDTTCRSCDLPLIDTAAPVAIQRHQSYTAMVLVQRRYEARRRALDPPVIHRVEQPSAGERLLGDLAGLIASVVSAFRGSLTQLMVSLRGSRVRNA